MSIPVTHKNYRCTSCDFIQSFTREPRPRYKKHKAHVEHRFCLDCKEITSCFTGRGGVYFLTDLNRPALFFPMKDYYERRMQQIEKEKTNNSFFSFKNIFGKYDKELNRLQTSLAQIHKGEKECERLTAISQEFYLKTKPKPRCLKCNSRNISLKLWSKDRCKCGGCFKFNETDSNLRISYAYWEVYEYDDKGYSIKTSINY